MTTDDTPRTEPRHGVTGYTNHGCRCDECREAWRVYSRKQRNTRPSRLAVEVERLREENAALRARLDELEQDTA